MPPAFSSNPPIPYNGTCPVVMGVLNVTPDSFSDGGEYTCTDLAVRRALEMIDEGAGIIDVGPESTRPGSSPVCAAEQIERAVPVVAAVRKTNTQIGISIDTSLASVAAAAIHAGANMVNDVTALRADPDMAPLVASLSASVVLMHMRGTPAQMQAGGGPVYGDVVGEIIEFLDVRRRFAVDAGIDPALIVLDPGIGFGKRSEDNLRLLANLDRVVALGQPVLVGASRKSFIGNVLAANHPEMQDPRMRKSGSLACAVIAAAAGASIIRAHDVRATVEAITVASAVWNFRDPARGQG